MNGTSVTHEELHPERTERGLRVFAGGGSFAEAIGGVAAVVVAIIGLAGGVQKYMMAIATIVLGVALILEGGAIAASFRRAFRESETEGAGEETSGAASFEFLAGITGIVLGILALIGVGAINYLVSVSVIVFGCALMLGCTAVSRLQSYWNSRTWSETGAGGQLLVGLAAIVLGIIAVVGFNTVILNLVALLALGVSVLLSGSSFGASTMMTKAKTT